MINLYITVKEEEGKRIKRQEALEYITYVGWYGEAERGQEDEVDEAFEHGTYIA